MNLKKLVTRFRIDKPEKLRLADHDPADTGGLDIGKAEAKKLLQSISKRLSELQERLWAQDRWAVLVILQGMDASGKDGVIEHVMAGVNPLGCEVHSFKAPNAQELDHDFLWRAAVRLPERGRIGIFNRSYYEEVLVVRVHDDLLKGEKLPPQLITGDIWQQRFEDIRAFEQHLARSGTLILKFHLRISQEEQRKRFLDRIEDPAKRWKFSMGDVAERKLWPRYMEAYEEAIRKTSTRDAPWYVVPSDHKWFARLAVAAALVEALERLGLSFPPVEGAALKELQEARRALIAEKSARRRS